MPEKNLYVNIILHLHFEGSSLIWNNSPLNNYYEIINNDEINMNISFILKNNVLLKHSYNQ